jgi:hypothetical protein
VSFDGCEFIERNLPGEHGTAQPALPNACLKAATSTGWSQTPCARLYVRDNLLDRPPDERRAEFANRLTNARRLEGEGEMNAAANDDKSPLIDLLCCIVCSETMKLEKSSPDAEGMDIIQYRCGRCNRIERGATVPPQPDGLRASCGRVLAAPSILAAQATASSLAPYSPSSRLPLVKPH